MLTGVVFFMKQLDGSLPRWLGYIYCPVLKCIFFVNEQRMFKGSAQPELGAAVDFREGATQEGKEFAAANSVRESTTTYSLDEPLVPLEVVAAIYRLPSQVIRAKLNSKSLAICGKTGETLLAIIQINALADWQPISMSAKQNRSERSVPPDNSLRFGQLVRHEFDRGFGFVKEQGKGKSEVFAHVKNLRFEPKINEWLVFAVGSDGRASWAQRPAQALPWLRKSYTTFSVAALDELFQSTLR